MKERKIQNLPAGFNFRPVLKDDVEELVDVFNAFSNNVYGKDNTSIEDMTEEVNSPDIDLENDTLVILNPEGEIKAAIIIFAELDMPVHPFLWGGVHPDYEGKGLGSFLLNWAEERSLKYLEKIPQDARLSVRLNGRQGYSPTEKLYAARGYKLYRQSFEMRYDLDHEPQVPEPPAGFSFRAVDPEKDAETVYRVQDEAFKDHFGYVEESFEKGFPVFKHFFIDSPAFDPEHWVIVEEGDEMVGVLIGRKYSHEDPDAGHIAVIGVRRPWRGRGLAGYMLKRSFAGYYKHGKKCVTLNVDGGSLTGALRLYENAGMRIEICYDRYEKELRSGKELSTVSLESEDSELTE